MNTVVFSNCLDSIQKYCKFIQILQPRLFQAVIRSVIKKFLKFKLIYINI